MESDKSIETSLKYIGMRLWDKKVPVAIIEKRVIGPYFLIRSVCANCPGKDVCKNRNGAGYVSLDNIPDCWYDLPCSSGESSRSVHIMTSKVLGESIASGNYHHGDDFCRFLLGWRNKELSEAQGDYMLKHYGYYPYYVESDEPEYSVRFVRLSFLEPLPSNKPEDIQSIVERGYKECVSLLPTTRLIYDVNLPKKPIVKIK